MTATYFPQAIQYADMVASKQSTMTDRRALLTDREREIISGDADVSDSYRYQTISRIRARFDRLAGDLQALESHESLADELRDEICDTGGPVDSGPQTPRETVDTPSDPEDDESPSDPPPTPTPGEDSQPFAAVDFPAGKDREQCVEAINAAREFLQDEGAATMREIVSAVLPEHSLGYDVDAAVAKVEAGERYRGAWWRRVVKPGLEAVDGVEKPARGASEWQYIGDR